MVRSTWHYTGRRPSSQYTHQGRAVNGRLTQRELQSLRDAFRPLIGQRFRSLSLPLVSLKAFEPSQIGTIVGALMDAMIPYLEIEGVGLHKHDGIIGDREGYPDYKHKSGKRVELKLVYVDNFQLQMKKPPTPREPSARVTQKVTVKNVEPNNDVMLLIAYRLEPDDQNADAAVPRIIDLDVFAMIEIVEYRDNRMISGGGRWFGNYEVPTILSKCGKQKVKQGEVLDQSSYGRKESEGRDYNEDTNFGKLKRIPHPELQRFLRRYRLDVAEAEGLDQAVEETKLIDEQELQD